MFHDTHSEDSPGVTFIPPKVFALAFIMGVMLEVAMPIIPTTWVTIFIGLIVTALAFCLMMSAHTKFQKMGTNVSTFRSASTMVTCGLYGRTRNPMYIGMVSIFAGLAITFSSIWMGLAAYGVWKYLDVYVVPREEAYMERAFGYDYRKYSARVPRWL